MKSSRSLYRAHLEVRSLLRVDRRRRSRHQSLAFWKSKSGFEADFILGDHTASELKASEHVGPNDLKSLKVLAQERKLKRYLCVILEARRRKVDEVTILHIHEFVKELWDESYS